MSAKIMDIRKQVKEAETGKRKLNLLQEQAKCRCRHTAKNGELDVVPANGRTSPNDFRYVCRVCQKEINFGLLKDEELKKSCDCIDRAVDTVKMQLDITKEADAKLLKALAKTQYRVRNEIVPLYAAALSKNRNGGNRSKNRNQSQSRSAWTQPRIER